METAVITPSSPITSKVDDDYYKNEANVHVFTMADFEAFDKLLLETSSAPEVLGDDETEDDCVTFVPTMRSLEQVTVNGIKTNLLANTFSSFTSPSSVDFKPTKRAHIAITAAAHPGWYLNKHLNKLEQFSSARISFLKSQKLIRKSQMYSNGTVNGEQLSSNGSCNQNENFTLRGIKRKNFENSFQARGMLNYFRPEFPFSVDTDLQFRDDDEYSDDDDYSGDEEEDPEVDELTGNIKIRTDKLGQRPLLMTNNNYENGYYDENGGNEQNETLETSNSISPFDEQLNGQQQNQSLQPNIERPLPPRILLPRVPRPLNKRQMELQKKTSKYMSRKKLETAAALEQPVVLTGNQLTTTLKYRVISLTCPKYSQCGRTFPGKVQLDSHLLSDHNISPFRCVYQDCEESFVTGDELTSHAALHSPGPFVCGLCIKGSSTSSLASYELLAKHTLNYHQHGEFRCAVEGCNSSARSRLYAVRHYHLVHLPYACSWKHCKQTFAYKPELDVHIAGHEAPRPFACGFANCNKFFLTKAHLAEHERIHTGIKPYICLYAGCDYAAKTRNSVLVHVRSKHLQMTRMSEVEKEAAELKYQPNQYVSVRKELL